MYQNKLTIITKFLLYDDDDDAFVFDHLKKN